MTTKTATAMKNDNRLSVHSTETQTIQAYSGYTELITKRGHMLTAKPIIGKMPTMTYDTRLEGEDVGIIIHINTVYDDSGHFRYCVERHKEDAPECYIYGMMLNFTHEEALEMTMHKVVSLCGGDDYFYEYQDGKKVKVERAGRGR